MIKLYLKLLKISYESLYSFNEDINDAIEWNKKRKIQNFKINQLVLEYIKNNKSEFLHDQFLLDMFNFFFYSSFRIRKFFFKNQVFKAPKSIFIILSFLHIIKNSIYLISSRLYIYLFHITKLPDNFLKNKAILTVGFPEHSYSKNDLESNYSSSLVEYLSQTGLIDSSTEIISYDEYSLKKLQEIPLNESLSFAKRINRIELKKTFSLTKISLDQFLKLLKGFYKTFKKFGIKPISFYSYYFTRVLIKKELEDIFHQLEIRKIQYNIVFISTYDLGMLKYDKTLNYFHFNYSRNNIYPSSQKIILNELNQSFDFSINNIIEEVELDNFTLCYPKSLGLNGHSYFYSHLRKSLNKAFNIELLENNGSPSEKIHFSNLGYSFLEEILLKYNKVNIIIFDIPEESLHDNISRRGIHGMYSNLRPFIKAFHKDILTALSDNKFEIYYKGKYSNSIQEDYLINKIASKENKNIHLINEYSKIDLKNHLKFNYSISLPFTSSFYNFAEISDKSCYYVPDKFLEFIPYGINGVCYGKKDLRNKILKNE